jgi:uncharacterized membrane protein
MSATRAAVAQARSNPGVAAGLLAFAAYHFTIAGLMTFAPHTFFTDIGPFGAQNDHYLRDTATFNAAFGATLLIAYWRVSWRTPVLFCVALQFALHTINHLADIGAAHPHWLGPADFAALVLSTVVLVWITREAHRAQEARA